MNRAIFFLVFGCMMVARPAQAFYNQSAGRWLSRDPIGERGGINLYGFVSNQAISRTDKLGLSFNWIQPHVYTLPRPVPVSYNQNDGFFTGGTDWEHFGPITSVYKPLQPTDCPCGYKINIAGFAQVKVWWVNGDKDSENHEAVHVKTHYYNAYAAFKENAESKGSTCYNSKAKADCIAAVIKSEMKTAYMNQAHAASADYDFQDYGGPREPRQSDYAKALERTNQALSRCEQVK